MSLAAESAPPTATAHAPHDELQDEEVRLDDLRLSAAPGCRVSVRHAALPCVTFQVFKPPDFARVANWQGTPDAADWTLNRA